MGSVTARSPLRVRHQRELFSADECARLRDWCGTWAPARTRGPDGRPTSTGDKRASWILLPLEEPTQWIFERLAKFLADHADYGFELTTIEAPLKVQRYGPGDYHGWHCDVAGNPHRKLGITVQLSEPHSYEGGMLEFFDPPAHTAAEQELGVGMMFPSFIPHRVTELTNGQRYALTAWVVGPCFR